MNKKITVSEKKEIEKLIIESFNKNLAKVSRLSEENFPTNDTDFDELLQRFKDYNEISDDITAVKEYIKMAKLRREEAEIDDMEYHANLWYRRLKAAEAKLKQLQAGSPMNEVDDDLLDFDIPEWALSALINGDYSGLEDDDINKLEAFTSRVASEYGNAHFMMNDIEGEDNLGSNVYRLYLRPSANIN
jgi:hypothetical protein